MKNYFKERFNLLIINTVNSYRVQTAYFAENWSSFASTFFWVLTALLFIKIVYSNVDTFAGYTQNEMLFFILIGQFGFYLDWVWDYANVESLIESVRMGELDLILVKPLPILFFITFRNINLINRLKDGVPNLLLLAFIVDWSKIYTSWDKVLFGLLIFLCGQIAWHCFSFLFALPVFFTGQSDQFFQISRALGSTNDIPFEGFTGSLRGIFMTIIPAIVTIQMTTSVILGKSNPIQMLGIAFSVAVIFLILKMVGWHYALKNYSSASS